MENLEDIIYYGVFIDQESKDNLLQWIKDHPSFLRITLENQVRYALTHITLIHCSQFEERPDILNVMGEYEGKTLSFNAISIGYSDKAMAFGVDIPNSLCANGKPHMTVCTMNGGKPFDSNNIENWFPIGEVIPIKGRISAFRKKPLKESLFMPFSLFEIEYNADLQTQGLLSEAYYKTYPTETTLKHIQRIFGQHIKDIYVQNNGGNVPNINVIIEQGRKYRDLNKAMSLCGYTLDFERPFEREYLNLQYSPRYSQKIKVENQQYLFHVSPAFNEGKILQKGISPRSSNRSFNYPDKVYLFLSHYGEGWSKRIVQLADIVYGASILRNATPKLTNKKDSRFNDDFKTWTVYQIDVSKLKKNMEFYRDTNWGEQAVFTYDNIPPEAIINHKRIELNDGDF